MQYARHTQVQIEGSVASSSLDSLSFNFYRADALQSRPFWRCYRIHL